MGCVNRSSKEFKTIAERNNVDSSILGLITHKYWEETKSEHLFPSDVYIQAQLGNSQYKELGVAVRKLWQLKYSSPQIFSSLKDLKPAYQKALKFFPETAVTYYRNSRNKYVLRVKQPVEKVNYNVDDFFLQDFSTAEKLDLGIDSAEKYAVEKIENLFNRFNTDRTSKHIASKIFKLAKTLGIGVEFNEALPFGTMGRYKSDNTITFKKSFFERDTLNQKKADIILHETIHAITMYALSDKVKDSKLSEQLKSFKEEINSIFKEIKNHASLKGEYGTSNVKEFVAELANPAFRNKLSNIELKGNKSVFQKIIDTFLSLFGIKQTSNYYERSLKALDKAINAFDKEAYMDYNGVRNAIKEGYAANEWEFRQMTEREMKEALKNALKDESSKALIDSMTKNEVYDLMQKTEQEYADCKLILGKDAFAAPNMWDLLKPNYKGKLVYAQSGTGKSTIADNINIIDSDYLLGQILGVSTETAGFFFKTLSAEQKKIFGERYRDLIRQKVKDGKTVLTANANMLEEADVVIYNSSAEQTDQRVNSNNRAISNKYSALDYHKETLDKIKHLKENEKDKEYIELDGEHYLSDYLLSNNTISRASNMDRLENKIQRTTERQLGNPSSAQLNKQHIINSFLEEFGITVNTLDEYNGDLPLFDALNRTINAQSQEDITDAVGYAIAFMMQGDSEMQRIFVGKLGYKGNYDTKIRKVPGIKRSLSIGTISQGLHKEKDAIIKEVGSKIANELRQHFGENIKEIPKTTENKSVWGIIERFLRKLIFKIFIKADKQSNVENQANISLFVSDIIEALAREDFSRIKGPRIKPGTTELAETVSIEKALKENPFEESIIKKLGDNGIALAGSASIALEGALYRPSENPLHDIDFGTPDNTTKEDLDNILPKIFGNDQVAYIGSIKKGGLLGMLTGNKEKGHITITYVTFDKPFTVKKINKYTQEYYDKKGVLIGKKYLKNGVQLEVYNGAKGKLLDFFTGPRSESEHGFYKKRINNTNYLISSSNAAIAAKILWARSKDMWDYKNFKKNKEEGISFDEPQFAVQPSKTFTFKDGTTVKAPFTPNNQQIDALNEIDRFIHSNESVFTLSGYAGTGKTSLMEMIAEKMGKERKDIVFTASTNQASKVLERRVSRHGYSATTLHKFFGLQAQVDPNREYDRKNLQTVRREKDITPNTIVVIDEASMIDDNTYDTIKELAQINDLKIIFTGDIGQLKPVKQDTKSKVFRNPDGLVFTLTQVERTGDNAILKEATDIRNGQPLSMESSFNDRGEGVAYMRDTNKEALDELIKYYIQGLKSDPYFFRILAYTNAKVHEYNNKVRTALGYEGYIPKVGEPIVGYENWGYHTVYNPRTRRREATYDIVNSESYKVQFVGTPLTKRIYLTDGTPMEFEATPVTLIDSDGKTVDIEAVDIIGNTENRQKAEIVGKELSELWRKRIKSPNDYDKISELQSALFVNDDILEGGRTVVKKIYDFGYASTVHKSQGSTYKHVLLDEADITSTLEKASKSPFGINFEDVDIDDTIESQAANGELVGNIEDAEDVDFAIEGQTSNDEMRQELLYVGVTRATTTVTIITKNPKTEDTPLNHIVQNNISVNSSAPSTQSTASPSQAVAATPSQFLSSSEVWNYVAQLTPTIAYTRKVAYDKGDGSHIYTIKDNTIYNEKGREVYPRDDANRRKILFKNAVAENRAVIVTDVHPVTGNTTRYIVDNNKQILSVNTGNIMQWDERNGDRNRILQQAEQKFRKIIDERETNLTDIARQTAAQIALANIDISIETTDAINEYNKYVGNNQAGRLLQAIQTEREMQSIREQAIKDGQIILKEDGSFDYALAPNGKRSNLNERQWLQVRTENFKKWFGDWINDPANASKVVDDNGEPLVVYRGDSAGKRLFEPKKPSYNVRGIYIAGNKTFASNFTKPSFYNNFTEGTLYAVFVNAKNPIYDSRDVNGWNNGKYDNNDAWIYGAFPNGNGELVVRNSNQIKSATDNNGEFSTKNNNIQMAISGFVDKYSLPQGELPVLSSALMSKYGNNTAYGDVIQTADYEYTVNYKGEGEFDIIEYHTIDNSIKDKVYDKERRSTGAYDRLSSRIKTSKRKRSSNNYDVTERGADADNVGLAAQASQGETQQTQGDVSGQEHQGRGTRLIKTDADGTVFPRVIETSDIQLFTTPQGQVYGFLTPDNKIFLDGKVMRPEHGIHEYTHLWDKVVMAKKPDLWKRGVSLMRQIDLWKQVENDENYGVKWKKKGATGEKLESLIASEVHSRLTGKQGQKIMEDLTLQNKSSKSIIGRLKQWLLDFWKDLKATFSNWSQEEINKLTLDDFVNMTLRDFADALDFSKIGQQQSQQQSSILGPEITINIYAGTNENADLSNFAERPFTIDSTDTALVKESGIQYKSVEQAFQHHKLLHVYDELSEEKFNELSNQILNATSAAQVKALGRRVPMSAASIRTWDEKSSEVMEQLIRASFQQNPQALQRLLDTGNATLTHTQDRGKWGKEFPRILMEVREELREETQKKKGEVEQEIGKDEVKKTIDTLNSDNKELSASEKKSISEILGDKKPRVLIASETSDPVFHAKKIKQLVEEELAKKPKDRRFHMMYLITKHDGLPLKELAQLKIPKFIHFSITSLGGTKYEPGVMKMNDMLDRIEQFIKDGVLNPNLVTIRIDPIIPGVTKNEDIRHIFERATKMGIRQFKFSVMDSYGYTESGERSTNSRDRYIIQKMSELGYDWDTYYGRDRNGKVLFDAKPQYVESIFRYIDALADEFNVMINTCGEKPVNIPNLKRIKTQMGCVNVQAMNAAMGTNDIAHVQGHQRTHCSCYGLTSDALRYDDKCASSCVYCYAKHNSNAAMKYYNGDGTLKDTPFTRTSEDQPVVQQNQTADITTSKETSTQQPSFDTSKAEEKPAENHNAVTLPNYQEIADYHEPYIVENEVIRNLLKDFDAQLSPDNPVDVQKKLIANIEILLNSPNVQRIQEQEAKYSNLSEESAETLKGYDKLNAQINNLRNKRYMHSLSSTEVREVAELIMNSISDDITRLQTEEGLAAQWFESLNTELDFLTATRKQIVDAVGIGRLLERAKMRMNPKVAKYTDGKTFLQSTPLLENWDAIISFGTDIFALNEGFGIKMNFRDGSYGTTKGTHIGFEESDATQDLQENEEIKGSEQESWQVDPRTVDILNNASQLIRSALHNCYLLDEKGNKIISRWKIPMRVNPREAVTSILNWVQGTHTLSEAVAKLQEKSNTHAWITQLITRLTDQSGKEADFQSEFFVTFCKSRTYYSKGVRDKKTFYEMEVNDNPAEDILMSEIKAKMRINESPIIKKGKINSVDLNKLLKLSEYFKGLFDDLTRYMGIKLTPEVLNQATERLNEVYEIIGVTVSKNIIKEAITVDNINNIKAALITITKTLKKIAEEQAKDSFLKYDPFEYSEEKSNAITSATKRLLSPVIQIMNETASNTVLDNGKMYQAFTNPSFFSLLIANFQNNKEGRKAVLERLYGTSEWFKTKDGKWRLAWMEKLANNTNAGEILKFHSELSFDKKNYMKTMEPEDYFLSTLANFVQDKKVNDEDVAWFRVPIQSNKPASDFVRFYCYRGFNYKRKIVDDLYRMFEQEIDRIQTVNMRNRSKGEADFIKSFDENGRRFNFLPFFNDYLITSNTLGTLLKDVEKDGKLTEIIRKKERLQQLTDEEANEFEELVKDAIFNYMQDYVGNLISQWDTQGLIEATKKVKGFGKNNKERIAKLEEFLWNDYLASNSILQLTIGDIAFYPNTEELQKRLAQLHAPGLRPNIEATDYKGKRVSDGVYRTLVLKDFDSFITNIVENLNIVFDKKIETAKTDNEKASWEAIKDSLTRPRTYNSDGSIKDAGGSYWNINVTDAQGFTAPSAYRKKALMFGKWSMDAEKIYQQLMQGNYKLSDIKTAFQPLKPFVYGLMHKNIGVNNTNVASPIQTMTVPFQAKNSEYLLIMADALLQGENTGKPNILRAIFRIMEDSELHNPTKGIDTIQFESAIKSGLQGAIDLGRFTNSEFGEEGAYVYMQNCLYKRGADGHLTNEYNTDIYVHELPYENFCLQQEVPAHFREHEQSQGSQERMIVPADLDMWVDPKGEMTDDNKNWFIWRNPDGTINKADAREARRAYEEAIANNINLSINELKEEFKLSDQNNPDKYTSEDRNIALSQMLQEDILDSPRYGIDLFHACSLVNGDFRIPLGDPTQHKRIEQLVNSRIKNRVNKQEVPGGPIVQVTNFGLSKQLHIRFNSKEGGLLLMEEDFNNLKKKGKYDNYNTYNDYCKDNQLGIAYFECYLPHWAKNSLKQFMDENGNIDIETIKLINPDILKMISYRIPTEYKYSIAPMMCVGFMPEVAGDAIMLPYELTNIDDSDFDVDKRYVIRKEIPLTRREMEKPDDSMTDEQKKEIKKRNKNAIKEHLRNAVNLSYKITQKEKDEITKDIKAKTLLSRNRLQRQLQEELQQIDRREQMELDALDKMKFSSDEEKNNNIIDKKYDKLEKHYQHLRDKKEEYYKKILEETESKEATEIEEVIQKYEKNIVDNRLEKFLNEDRKAPASEDDALTRNLRKAYLSYMFPITIPTKGKIANDNKVFDISWAILTHESTADKILNPGNFDNFKKIGYMIAASKKTGRSWQELDRLSSKELRKLYYTDSSLGWYDTQLQFYRQNKAASSLLEIFAVSNISHAILSNDPIFYRFEDTNRFTLAGIEFNGDMKVDPVYDFEGNLVSKTTGSGVGASADAAKDPVLNLMNVNGNTVNAFITMLRLGVPDRIAGLLLSQNIMDEVLATLSLDNLKGYTSLESVIDKYLKKLVEDYHIEGSKIDKEDLTEKELILGLNDSKHPEIDYKALSTIKKVLSVAKDFRNITLVTRFNSVSTAAGPQVVNTLALQHKVQEFTNTTNKPTGFYDAAGDIVDFQTVCSWHPILEAFSRTLDLADSILKKLPANSLEFRKVLGAIPESLKNKILGNAETLDKLLDFYLSYQMVNSNLIDERQLSRYIENFPKWFSSEGIKKLLPDNPLIQAIQLDYSRSTDRTFLKLPIVGIDEQTKGLYRSAWADLYRKGETPIKDKKGETVITHRQLSDMLLTYWFFRGGIGFSPKTGISVLPNEVKEGFSKKLSSGAVVTYNDVFKDPDAVTPELVIDQFIRNNWNDSSLVPKKEVKDESYKNNKTLLQVTNSENISSIGDSEYIKTTLENETYLWKRREKEKGKIIENNEVKTLIFDRITPLGNNNEYIVVSKNHIMRDPISDTTQDIEDLNTPTEDNNNVNPDTPIQTNNEDTQDSNTDNEITDSQAEQKVNYLAQMLFDYRKDLERKSGTPGITKEKAQNMIDEIAKEIEEGKGNRNKKFLTNFFNFIDSTLQQKGATISESDVIERFKQLNIC